MPCPTQLLIGRFERPRTYGNARCTYLLNLEPRGSPKRAGTLFHLLLGGTSRPWKLAARVEQHEERLARLEAQARDDSRTSSKPPSSDPPRTRAQRRAEARAKLALEPDVDPARVPEATGAPIGRDRRRHGN
jgi:hypothetical protein